MVTENKLEVFANDEFGNIRTVMIDGEPWFVGKDVAVSLGYTNSRKAIKDHIDYEDKGVTKCYTPSGVQTMSVINESGLYSLILSSKLPSAKKFKHWITAEVLPSIRKHGAYMTDNLLDAVMENPEIIPQVVDRLNADRQISRNRVTQLENELNKALPKAVYFDKFVETGFTTNFRDTAKEMGIPQKCFIELLLKYKFIFRTQKYELRPNSKALEKGYFILRDYINKQSGHRGTYTLVTAKGKKFIYEFFVKKGIIQ